MHKEGKLTFQGPPGGSAGSYQSSIPSGQAPYNQYGQGYGQAKKSFNQNQGGTAAYSYSTAYPSQVTGGAGASQEYNYDGESLQDNQDWSNCSHFTPGIPVICPNTTRCL